jgi:hypothetical protein
MLISRLLAVALACALLAAPAAGAQDLRSPDARDAAAASAGGPSQDLRSPDARDAASASSGLQLEPMSPPEVSPNTLVDASTGAPDEATGGNLDWTLIALSAGGFLLAIAVVVIATAIRARRRVVA